MATLNAVENQTTQGQETGQECAWCATGYPTATQARGIVHLLPGGIEVRCYRGAPVFAASPTPRSGGVPTSVPTLDEAIAKLHAAFSAIYERRAAIGAEGEGYGSPEHVAATDRAHEAEREITTLLQHLHAAAVQGAEDRERLDRLEKLVPVHIGFEGDGFESERIELVEERGNVNDRQFTSIAVADTLREAIDALLAARQPRPEGQGVEG